MKQWRWFLKSFDELSTHELYQILELRSAVFVVEQNCAFNDLDFNDQKAQHFFALDEQNTLVAYTRLFAKDVYYQGYVSIGRVVSSPKFRGLGLGKLLMEKSILQCQKLYGDTPIKIGAQQYLNAFYVNLGFENTGEDYLEDGIPHTYMLLKYKKDHS